MIKRLIHRPNLVIVITLIALMLGGFAFSRLSVDMLPDIESPALTIVTAYPGASALDVEEKLTEPIEETLGSIANVKQITSLSRDNASQVILVFNGSADISEAANDARQALEGVKMSLPSESMSPVVYKLDMSQLPIMQFTVRGDGMDVRELRDQLDTHLLEPLRRIQGVGGVFIRNAPPNIVHVDVSRDRLASHGLTMVELSQLLEANNLSVPAGSIDVGEMNFGLRFPATTKTIDEFKRLPLIKSPVSGGMINLSDVAEVSIGLKETPDTVLVNGETAILGALKKTTDSNLIDIHDEAMKVFDQAEKSLPPGIHIHLIEDAATYIRGTISNLQNTVMMGVFLVALVVFAFLRRLGPTFIVAMSIPTALIVTFLIIYLMGFTLNSVTLIAMSLSVGLVVDNSVVALENISRKIDEGIPRKEAAAEGASEVASALLASTSTTLVIFTPMLFISGIVGQMFSELAIVMIVTITASLLVSLTLAPMLAARIVHPTVTPEEAQQAKPWEKRYISVLRYAIARPLRTIGVAIIIGIFTVVALSRLGTDFLPKDDVGQLAFTAELPVGTSRDKTLEIASKYVDALRLQPEVEIVSLRVGHSEAGTPPQGKEGDNVAQIRARLSSPNDRIKTDKEIRDSVLTIVGNIPEVINLDISTEGGGASMLGATKPVVVELLGDDLDDLQVAATQVQRGIMAIPGAINVNSDLFQTRPELRISPLREQANRLGIPLGLAGQELRYAVNGAVATRFVGDGAPMDVMVRFAEEDRRYLDDWSMIPVRTQTGKLSTLGELATLEEGEAPIQIQRVDKSRMISVSTELKGRSLGELSGDIESMMDNIILPEGVRYQIAGQIKDQRESFGDMGLLMTMGMIMVFLVMVAQFESWLDPFIILTAVPFAATGAFFTLLISGTTLTVTAFLGLVILIGVVVNNAIVLLDYIKLLRRQGQDLMTATVNGCQRRLRPILITTLTTSGGMLPLALTKGEGEQLWGPMGKTALGGLLVSSVITLILAPVIYTLLSGISDKVKFKYRRFKGL